MSHLAFVAGGGYTFLQNKIFVTQAMNLSDGRNAGDEPGETALIEVCGLFLD